MGRAHVLSGPPGRWPLPDAIKYDVDISFFSLDRTEAMVRLLLLTQVTDSKEQVAMESLRAKKEPNYDA